MNTTDFLQLPPELLFAFVLLFGLIFGSFVTMACHRIPLKQDLICKRSHCTACHHPLGVLDLIPVFSWVFSLGKCRHCKVPISFRYPLIELSVALGFCFIFASHGFSFLTLLLFLTWTCLITMVAIDICHDHIPKSLFATLLLLGLGYVFLTKAEPIPLLITIAIGLGMGTYIYASVRIIKKSNAFDYDDMYLIIISSLFMTTPAIMIAFLLLASVIGVVLWPIFRFVGHHGTSTPMPFSEALTASFLICITNADNVLKLLGMWMEQPLA
tara:strand:- start:106 stop:915 length:810 start_codon:yes stop_codon:yes gene_type:complete